MKNIPYFYSKYYSMNHLLESNKRILKKYFQEHEVEKAYVFGSVLTEEFDKNSDIDFLIEFRPNLDPLKKGELWWNLYDALRELLDREIDLVTKSSLKNPYFIKEIENTKRLIYGQ